MSASASAFCRRAAFSTLLVSIFILHEALAPSLVGAESVVVARSTEVDEVTAQVQARLRAALEEAETARRKWPRLNWQGIECYVPGAVRHTFDELKGDLRQAANDPRLAGLQSYIGGKLESVGRMPPTMLITQPSVFRGRTTRVLGVRTDQADSSWSELRNFVESFLASAKLAVDLTVASEPSGAQIQVQAGNNADNRMTLATTCQLKNVWRGLYRVKVEKPGYKASALDVDLVNQGGVELSCKLAKVGEAEDSRCTQAPMK